MSLPNIIALAASLGSVIVTALSVRYARQARTSWGWGPTSKANVENTIKRDQAVKLSDFRLPAGPAPAAPALTKPAARPPDGPRGELRALIEQAIRTGVVPGRPTGDAIRIATTAVTDLFLDVNDDYDSHDVSAFQGRETLWNRWLVARISRPAGPDRVPDRSVT